MTRRLRAVWLAPLVCVAGLATPAAAGTPVPKATVVTYLPGGVAAPTTLVSARWGVLRAGRSARLSVSGRTLTGTTTVMSADWVSVPFRPRRGLVLSLRLTENQQYVVDLSGNQVSLQVRIRMLPGQWSPWFGGTGADLTPPRPWFETVSASRSTRWVELSTSPWLPPPLTQVEVRLVDRWSATATAGETLGVSTLG